MKRTKLHYLAAALACAGWLQSKDVLASVDDYEIHVTTVPEVSARRSALIGIIWGTTSMPAGPNVLVDNTNPFGGLENLQNVEHLRTTMPGSTVGTVVVSSYHLVPIHRRNRLVVVHYGHTCVVNFSAEIDGLKPTIRALLKDGYGVLVSLMPFSETEPCDKTHNMLFAPGADHPWRFFLEPVAKSLNYIDANYPSYRDYNMVGLSGGGWTTVVYAAIDPRIKTSVQVAGSIPLYLQNASYQTDAEQSRPGLYSNSIGGTGYPDLYVLGSTGAGRRQIQALNRNDDCCFNIEDHDTTLPHVMDKPANQRDFESSVRLYESRVKSAVAALGTGSFRVVIYDVPGKHLISNDIINNVIRRTLNVDDALKVVTPVLFE